MRTPGRQFNLVDHILCETDHALRTLFAPPTSTRPSPAKQHKRATLSEAEQKDVSGLMRVDHTGEVCAQALYRGQAFVERDEATREHLHHAADEEQDHLAWCGERLDELHAHPSYLNLFWYGASFKLGMLAGVLGKGWSMGFVVETENQVEAHLDEHIARLPKQDKRSQAILKQMKTDEVAHAKDAQSKGAKVLPKPIRMLMKGQSKVMTSTAYYF